METSNLKTLFFPESIAVVGASNRFGKWGFNLAATLLVSSFSGPVYLVNPKKGLVLGRQAFPDLGSLPKPVDLAVLAVPADRTIPLIEECGRLGIPNALVVASNFKEVGAEGARIEEKLVQAAQAGQVRIVGPNTMGMVSTPVGLEILFMPLGLKPGPVDVISQSGNIGLQIMELGMKEGLGISRFVGSGNEALLGVEDYLSYFGQDEYSRVIVLYLEGIRHGERFFEAAKKITPHKPILALKAGKTSHGSRAARSHSGAVAQSPKMISDLFKQAGIIEAQSTEELIDLIKTFSLLKPPPGDRLGVVSLGGGWGVATTDAAALNGLNLPTLSSSLIERLNALLPPFWSHQNPLDLAGTTNRRSHIEVLRTLCASDEIDVVIALGMLAGMKKYLGQLSKWKGLILKHKIKSFFSKPFGFLKRPPVLPFGQEPEKTGLKQKGGFRVKEFNLWKDAPFVHETRRIMEAYKKPILLVTFLPGTAVQMTRRFGLPVFGNPERAVGSMHGLIEYGEYVRRSQEGRFTVPEREKPTKPLPAIVNESIDEHQGKQILEAYGIPVTREGVAKTKGEVLSLARTVGYPVALKILSPSIQHKTEQGGVILSIPTEEELERAVRRMEERFPALKNPDNPESLLIQEMVSDGVEVFLGMINDPQFGPLLVVGLGGILVEVLKDVAFAKPPVSAFQAEQLWRSLRGSTILDGVRGKPPADLPALIKATVDFSCLIEDLGRDFEGIDINPLMVSSLGRGVKALDALFVTKTPGT
ncbi:MAG: acetate--CoA ligase family protein [Deltaproteobacteria bacterium]|nr:acetate--CoA ligase family protein [Deltaproteobacteria bacterium]